MIKCNPISNYPTEIDELVFFQDNDLENIGVVNEYNRLISKGKYDEAIQYINENGNIYGYFADFFNLIENRIYNLQEYILTKFEKTQKKQPFIFYDDTTYNLTIFSDTDIQESTTDDLYVFSDDNISDQFEVLSIFTGDNETDIVKKDEIEPPNLEEDTIWI